MDGARPGGRQANTDLAGQLSMTTGHEGGFFFMAHLNEMDFLFRPAKRADNAVDPVARIPVDPFDTPFAKSR